MKLLVFSDIHDNIAAVQSLRDNEKNEYDVVIVAGDIGGGIINEFRSIMNTFECPVFYVYGNWDYDQPYGNSSLDNCILLNQNIQPHHGYFFTGFSGCPTNWGMNPFYLAAINDVEEKYSSILVELHAINSVKSGLIAQLDVEYKKRRVQLLTKKEIIGDKEHRKAREQLRLWRARKLIAFEIPEQKLKKTDTYASYLNDLSNCGRKAYQYNRQALIDLIKSENLPESRLIVVTHERLFKLADEGVTPLLHIFGHRHEYKFTSFMGANYLNAASLDSAQIVSLEGNGQTPSGYCCVTIEAEKIMVTRKILSSCPVNPHYIIIDR